MDSSVHDVEIVLSLDWLDGDVSDLEGALDAAKEGSNLGDPEALKMRGRDIRVFKQRGTKTRVVLNLVQGD